MLRRKGQNQPTRLETEKHEFIGPLKIAQGLVWGFAISIVLWLIFGALLTIFL